METSGFASNTDKGRYGGAIAGAYALLAGGLSLLGLAAGIYRLTDWGGSGISIKANTALTAAVAGMALLLVTFRPSARRSILFLGLFVAGVGGLTLFEHLTGISLGIDTLLLDEPPGAPATTAPGRMGPPAATSYLLIGTALGLMLYGGKARTIAAGLGIAALVLGMLSLTGYWFGAEVMYAMPRLTGISMQTASIVTALGIGVVAVISDRQPMLTFYEHSNTGILARRLLPLIIFVPLVLGWLRLLGQEHGLYDAAFGTAMRTVIEVVLLAGLVWWILQAVRVREIKQKMAEEALIEADHRKDEFLATLAHELRNPLAPIRQAAEIARSPAVTPAQLQWSHDVIVRQSKNMARLLDDLLDVSRITRGTLEVRKAPVSLSAVLDAAVELAQPAIDARRHSLVVELPATPVSLNVDALRIAQVIANLLTNAAKYSEPGGRITLAAHSQGHQLAIRVSDNGIGIDADMLPEVFGMFVQPKLAIERTEGGLGIGLSIAKALVELHQGTLEAHSAGVNQGSEFTVYLPLERQETAHE